MSEDWRVQHKDVIVNFLNHLNSVSDDFVLKGGTALMTCYNLDRFSEDIDLDGRNPEIEKIVASFCKEQGVSYRTAKDTDTVKRFMIHYGNPTGKPLKVEISYRRKSIDPSEITKIYGVSVYRLESLCIMKANAYASRDRIRDLYDLAFICNHHWDELSAPTKALVRATVEHKGIEQFDYLIQTQSDELIDKDKLAADFLEMFDRLDLLADSRDRGILEDRAVTQHQIIADATVAPVQANESEPETSSPANVADKKKELYSLIKDTAENYATDPQSLSELFEFGSRFYNYSVRNNILIKHQNPHATYVQSFNAWKGMEDVDCSVKRGEKGIKVLVPVKCTYLEIEDELVPLREATKAQAAAHKRGEIESIEKLRFKVGTVFDISQTNFPKERYPELYSMGYQSDQHKEIIRGLTDYSREKFNCPVVTTDLQSIALRGAYSPSRNEISLNALLEDTEKLSTLSHELGHAMVHNNPNLNKSVARMEFEADAMCIMIQAHCGIEVSDVRKRHLSDNYNKLFEELKANPETGEKALAQTQQIFSSVFDVYKNNIADMQQCIQRYIPDAPTQTQKQTQTVKIDM